MEMYVIPADDGSDAGPWLLIFVNKHPKHLNGRGHSGKRSPLSGYYESPAIHKLWEASSWNPKPTPPGSIPPPLA